MSKIILKHGGYIVGKNGSIITTSKPVPPYNVIGGKEYRTVIMPDGKEWLAENLDFAWDGLSVPTANASTSTDPQAMYYGYDESTYGWNGYKCGLLYNWYAVNYLEEHKSTLIPGWHVPTDDEWNALASAIGGTSTAGTKLKALDNSAASDWPSGWNGTDDFGFSALPDGFYAGNFNFVGSNAFFWTATEYNSSRAYSWYFGGGPALGSSYDSKINQNSVRLVLDAT